MATMKSEFLSHYQAQHGVPLRSRLFGAIRRLNRLGSATAPLSNLPLPRGLIERVAGIDRRRPLPRFAARDAPALGRKGARAAARRRGDVVFLADSFTTFTEPAIGRAAIELLEAAGWNVRLESAGCCGRSSISKGLLDQAPGHGGGDGRPARARGRARRPDRRLRAVVPADAARGAPGAASATRARRPSRTPRGSSRSCSSRRSTTARCGSTRTPRSPTARSSSTATATRRRWPAPPPRSRCWSASRGRR